MKTFLSIILFFLTTQSFALSLEEITNALKENSIGDTVEMLIRNTARVNELEIVTQMHSISKGKQKVWVEVESSVQKQRIIQNKNRMQVTDLKTGISKVTRVNTENIIQPISSNFNRVFSTENFLQPVKQANGLFLVQSNPSNHSEDGVIEKILFDSKKNHIVSMQKIHPDGKMTQMSFEYCENCEKKGRLQKVTTISETQGKTVNITMEILLLKRADKISDQIFEFLD